MAMHLHGTARQRNLSRSPHALLATATILVRITKRLPDVLALPCVRAQQTMALT